jgi:hypothetical protein
MALPMPRLAPVTMATFPFKDILLFRQVVSEVAPVKQLYRSK